MRQTTATTGTFLAHHARTIAQPLDDEDTDESPITTLPHTTPHPDSTTTIRYHPGWAGIEFNVKAKHEPASGPLGVTLKPTTTTPSHLHSTTKGHRCTYTATAATPSHPPTATNDSHYLHLYGALQQQSTSISAHIANSQTTSRHIMGKPLPPHDRTLRRPLDYVATKKSLGHKGRRSLQRTPTERRLRGEAAGTGVL